MRRVEEGGEGIQLDDKKSQSGDKTGDMWTGGVCVAL